MTLRWRLFPKYATLIIALVGGMLVASGGISLYFSYRENQEHLVALQREKAEAAAGRIEQYIGDIEHQLGWTAMPQVGTGGNLLDQRRFEYLKLLRQVPAITEVAWIDASGREQLKVSRLAMDVSGADTDLARDPKFLEAKSGKTWYSPVYFRKETEPYMTISRPAGSGGGVTIAEVNLKFVWEVVSRIKIGQAGLAFVVNSAGTLIAHPDISLVLQKTDLTKLAQVAALAQGAGDDSTAPSIARDVKGVEVLTAHARIPTLNWTVFVELPLAEAFKPVYESIQRMGLLLLAGLVLSMLASFFLARLMVRPIRALQEGAAQIGTGNLDQKITVTTGDELESLAGQFNQMAAHLKESYTGLEQKVEERTGELTESLEQQTATAEILRVISSSPTDVQPVFEAIASSSARLIADGRASVWLAEHGTMRPVAFSHPDENSEAMLKMYPAPLDGESMIGHILLDPVTLNVPDVMQTEFERGKRVAELRGFRSFLGVPLILDGRAVGAIGVVRVQAGAFAQKQIALLETFAAQAAIAIQNVRLFNETKEALERQTATAEILKVISSSPTDVQPVLDAIVNSAQRLIGGLSAAVTTLDGDVVLLGAFTTTDPSGDEQIRSAYPAPLSQGGLMSHLLQSRAPFQISDIESEMRFGEKLAKLKEVARARGWNSMLAVPMIREGEIIGAIIVSRREKGSFSDHQVGLIKTFADQAVIAIENVRLFNEIQDKSRQLEIAGKHKSEFLANMSHELRTPLNAIIGFSEVLLEKMFGEMNEKQEDYLKDIHSSGKHLLSLINDILDLAKVEAGRMELNLSKFDLPTAINNALTLIRERAMRQSIALAAEVDPQLGELNADERKLKQILLNLLSNAVKFTPEGGSITVGARIKGDMIEIAVTDTGIGIAPEDQAAVFEEFKQVGTDYTRKAEGTGLGLALTRRLVELHGGAMRLESEPGKGSTFAFTLPLNSAAPGAAATSA
jgi:signal transduction histidine kinase